MHVTIINHSIDAAKLPPRDAMVLVTSVDAHCLPTPPRMGQLIHYVLQMPSLDFEVACQQIQRGSIAAALTCKTQERSQSYIARL